MKSYGSQGAQPYDRWYAFGAVAAVIFLQVLLRNDLSFGPGWLAPAVETAMLALLAIDALRSRSAPGENAPTRRLALALAVVITLMNLAALMKLVLALLDGKTENGETLLLDALSIWAITVIAFALCLWLLDHGGPWLRAQATVPASEFVFAQSTIDPRTADLSFNPGFVDYLFLSFTNATAFSPTDTVPLTHRMKFLVMVEASISLLTIALVAARAVNILA